jgi:phospholipid/cholesterol/gamma-HCH transport system substrate-binding protein
MTNPFSGLIHRSFLERSPMLIGIIGILLIAIGSTLALLLSGGVFASTYSVTARFTDAAGIRPGDDVTVAGLDAGRVGAVEISDGSVTMELKINSDVVMPADSRAEIVVETLLGKKSVDLVAGRAGRELREGDVISLDRTATPIEVTDLNDASVALLERSDAQALEDLMSEVTSITKGKEKQLGTLIDGLADVSLALEEKRSELSGLLRSMSTLATTFGENDRTLVSLIDRYDRVLGNLAARRDDLTVLLDETDTASHEVADLVTRNRSELDSTLSSLHQALEVVNDHQLDLAAGISYLEQSVRGYSSVGYSQGVPNRWANIFVQSVGPVGVDALVGRCGLLDQAFDEILGPDPRSCEDRRGFGEENGGPALPVAAGSDENQARGRGSRSEADPGGGPGLPELPDEPLPGDIGDLFDRVTGGVLGEVGL